MMRAYCSVSMRRARTLPIVVLILGSLVSSSAGFGLSAGGSFRGLSLTEALEALGDLGLEIFFTSNLVRPEMRVVAAPTAKEPREILEQLLAPHGLTAEAGPGGRLVVVVAAQPSVGIRGLVVERHSDTLVAGVRIVIPALGTEAVSASDGSFRLLFVAVGDHALEAHLPGYVVKHMEITVEPGQEIELVVELDPAQLAIDEIIVTPSRISLNSKDPVTGLDLDRDDIFALPHLGDDTFRAMTLLPGVTGDESSARFNVRGGRADEVLMLLDQVELFEPFHLKDFGSAISIVTPRALEEVNLITGGFPAEYGDRMSGVLDMNTFQPRERKTLLGLSLLTAEVGSSGTFDEQRGDWISSARRGQLDLALDFFGQRLKPRYWDTFAKVHYQVQPQHRLGVHVLHSDDSVNFFNVELGDTEEDYDTGYGSSYLWLTHQAILGPRLFVDTVISRGRVDRDRQSREVEFDVEEEEAGFQLIDRRELNATGIKQDWSYQHGDRYFLKWGFDVRRLETDYDYFNERNLDDPLVDIRFEPRTGLTEFQRRLSGEQHSAYLSGRLRPVDALTLELGLRYDEHTVTRDANFSPRINWVYAP
ncbi:MAG: TonB-dependent receptor, partial [Acidobacteriota bacterium]